MSYLDYIIGPNGLLIVQESQQQRDTLVKEQGFIAEQLLLF